MISVVSFKVKIAHGNAIGNNLEIIIPVENEIKIVSGSTGTGLTCGAHTCDIDETTRTIKIINFCAGACADNTAYTVTVPNTYLENQPWVKTPADLLKTATPIDSIQFLTKLLAPDDQYFVDASYENVAVTPTLVPNVISISAISRSDNLINKQVDYNFTITLDSNAYLANSMISLQFPDEVVYVYQTSTVEIYLDVSGVWTKLVWDTSSITYHTSGAIDRIYKVVACPTGCAKGDILAFKVVWVKNPPYVVNTTDVFDIHSETSKNWPIDILQSSQYNDNLMATALLPLTVSQFNVYLTDPTELVTNSQFKAQVTVLSDIPKDSYLEVHIPDVFPNAATFSTCTDLFDTNTLTCTKGASGIASHYMVKIQGHFTATGKSGTFGVLLGDVTNPAVGTVTGITVKLYSSQNYLIGALLTPPTIDILAAIPDASCTSPCSKCAGTPTHCTDCADGSSNPIFDPVTNTCNSKCPDGYFIKQSDRTCYQCS